MEREVSEHHIAKLMGCRSCVWFVSNTTPIRQEVGVSWFGRCRRHAPNHDGFPGVYSSDWCGDHRHELSEEW